MNDGQPRTDKELLAGLRAGEEQAFASIFRSHYPALVRSATRLLGDRSLGEDVAQEVMLELWRRRAGLLVTGSIGTYLQQATRNRAFNRLRHERIARRSEPLVKPPSPSAAPSDRALSAELRRAASVAYAALTAPQREVFELSRTRGLTYAEIADLLGISIKTVEARMGRALSAMRAGLAEWLPGDGP